MILTLTDERVATLVSTVTQKLLGIRFGLAPLGKILPTLCWRAAVLDIGDRSMSVGLSSDRDGCTTLGAALFDVAAAAVNTGIINDSLAELVNMTAGQIKDALRLDEALGLPRIVDRLEPADRWRLVRLRGGNDLEMLVWIAGSTPPNHGVAR